MVVNSSHEIKQWPLLLWLWRRRDDDKDWHEKWTLYRKRTWTSRMPCCCVLGEPAIHPIKGRQRLSSKLYSFHILHLTDVLLNQKSKKKNWERNLLSEWRQSRLERPWKLKRTMITKQSRLDAFLFFFFPVFGRADKETTQGVPRFPWKLNSL